MSKPKTGSDGEGDARRTDPDIKRVKKDLADAREKLRSSPVPTIKVGKVPRTSTPAQPPAEEPPKADDGAKPPKAE